MDSIKDLMQQRADELDLGRQDELTLIQQELDRLFSGGAKAHRIDHKQHTVTVAVSDSSVASFVRMSQPQILSAIKNLTHPSIEKVHITLK